jgi:hypothetical protein
MADVPQMADTDPNMTIVALQKEDRSIEEIGQAASDVMSRETCTQGGSLNSHPQVNKSTHERMNELASTMGYIISSKCEWLDGINTATISIVDPRASTESEKKGLLIGMCSGVDAMTAVAGASESGLKYLENMAALKRAVGDSQGPVKAPLNDVEAGLEMPDNVQVGRKSKWDMRPEPAPTSQEHNQSDNNHDESMQCEVEKKPAEQAKKEEAATRPSGTRDDKKQSGTPTKRETTSRSSKEEPKHATGSKKKEEEKKPRPMTRQVEKKPAEQAKKEAAQRPSGTKDDKKQSGTPTKRETTSRSSKEEPKHSMGPMKKTEEKPRPMKREIERNTTPSKRARYSDEKGRGGSPWGSGSRLDNEIYSEVDGRIRCHLCKNSFPSGKYYLDKHDRGRRHQEKLRETSRKRTIRQPLDSEGEQSPRTWTNSYVIQCRESLDEIRRKCGNTARGMGVKLLPGSPYFSKGHFEARIQGEAISERVRFGKRTLGFGQGSTRNEALIDAYEKSFDELTRVRDQENQRKRKKYPRTHDSGHQGDSLGQPNFSFNIK